VKYLTKKNKRQKIFSRTITVKGKKYKAYAYLTKKDTALLNHYRKFAENPEDVILRKVSPPVIIGGVKHSYALFFREKEKN